MDEITVEAPEIPAVLPEIAETAAIAPVQLGTEAPGQVLLVQPGIEEREIREIETTAQPAAMILDCPETQGARPLATTKDVRQIRLPEAETLPTKRITTLFG